MQSNPTNESHTMWQHARFMRLRRDMTARAVIERTQMVRADLYESDRRHSVGRAIEGGRCGCGPASCIPRRRRRWNSRNCMPAAGSMNPTTANLSASCAGPTCSRATPSRPWHKKSPPWCFNLVQPAAMARRVYRHERGPAIAQWRRRVWRRGGPSRLSITGNTPHAERQVLDS
jgi:hypothetical protein